MNCELKIRDCAFGGEKFTLHGIVHCATKGENELFLARMRCSARVGVVGAEGA